MVRSRDLEGTSKVQQQVGVEAGWELNTTSYVEQLFMPVPPRACAQEVVRGGAWSQAGRKEMSPHPELQVQAPCLGTESA